MRILSYAFFQAPGEVYWRSDKTVDRFSAYGKFLPALVRAHRALWPGYEMRIYHDNAVRAHAYFPALERLHGRDLLRLMPCGDATALTLAMLWRMKPLFDENEHFVLTCDLDALPLLRLRQMVEDFAGSPRAAMVVHGCESHNGVLGGGIAAKAAPLRSAIDRSTWEGFVALGDGNWHAYAADEMFLRNVIWPKVADNAVVFRQGREGLIIRAAEVRPLPTEMNFSDIHPLALARGNDFAPYTGSAGYDLDAAFAHYDSLPSAIEIRACEEGVDLQRVLHP